MASALDALADRAAHWTLVSSVSVYSRSDMPFADETAELVEPTDLGQYADAKVHAERITSARRGDQALLARAGLIVGPGDPTDRFGYWPARYARGGRVLAPEATGRHVQAIDVDDLAAWIDLAGRTGITGPVNAVGEELPLSAVLAAARDAAAHDAPETATETVTSTTTPSPRGASPTGPGRVRCPCGYPRVREASRAAVTPLSWHPEGVAALSPRRCAARSTTSANADWTAPAERDSPPPKRPRSSAPSARCGRLRNGEAPTTPRACRGRAARSR